MIGPPGSGKTSVGRALAEALDVEFIDSDLVISNRCGMPVPQIFSERGERSFRAMERDLMLCLSGWEKGTDFVFPERFVLSVGGGLPVEADNMDILLRAGTVVYLKTSLDELVGRLSGTADRPLLKSASSANDSGVEQLALKIASLLEERKNVYSRAHYKLLTDGLAIDEVAAKIAALVSNERF